MYPEFQKCFCGSQICPKLVQSGLSPTVSSIFESPPAFFHTVFNRTVENFYKVFIKISVPFESVARKLLQLRNFPYHVKSRHFGAA
jgi:hypothetical protein